MDKDRYKHDKILKIYHKIKGSFSTFEVEIDGTLLNIFNCYAHTQEKIDFYTEINNTSNQIYNKIMGGDFNVVLDHNLDTTKKRPVHRDVINIFKTLLGKFNLKDVYIQGNVS